MAGSDQMLWDITAAVASGLACVFIFTRRRMLSGDNDRWHSAPRLLQAALAAQAIFMGCVAISITFGGHVNAREALAYVFTAAVSMVFTINLHRTGQVEAERADLAAAIPELMAGRVARRGERAPGDAA